MPFSSSLRLGVVITLIAAGMGCLSTSSSTAASAAGSGGSQASSAGSATGGSASAGASSSGSSGGGTSTGVSSASTGTSSGAGSSTGGTTGLPPPVYVDGGYVWCSLETDAGSLTWQCLPGTYFCATDGTETCTECLSDADCDNDDLPTFDPLRQHCDLHSGFAGYQGYCQECLTSAQCLGSPGGPYCDLNPKDATASIVNVGFETCEPQPVGCGYGTAPGLGGGCVSSFCAGDADCANVLTSQQQPALFCVGGTCATTPNGDACPNCYCDRGCGQPGSQPLDCDGGRLACGCTEADQCGGPWPVCEVTADGDAGTCGCDGDAQCGDAGLKCMVVLPEGPGFGGSFCGVSCDDPRFPGCGLGPATTPLCDAASGLCAGCGSDDDCQTKATGPSAGPYCRVDGACGCARSGDCPAGLTCQDIDVQSSGDQSLLGLCAVPLPPCGPTSCQGYERCEPDSGACVGGCTIDEDCWSADVFCDPDGGECVGCRDDLDCKVISGGVYDYCSPTTRECGYGCSSDAECATNPAGPECNTAKSSCGCATDAECPAGEGCTQYSPSYPAACGSYCLSDADCPASFFCDPGQTCRARCDPGHACQAPDTICDVNDVGMMNADGGAGDAGVVTWCYRCLRASDCPAGEACETTSSFQCGRCNVDVDCPPGDVCRDTCLPRCDAGLCPAGLICSYGGCYECLTPSDCPNGEGCDSATRTCGRCFGPTATYPMYGDCPPAAICSSYWTYDSTGVCLQNCDDVPCPVGETCAILPDLTPDHHYCFGCLADADCADAGPGAWCDVSVNLTFTCQPGPI